MQIQTQLGTVICLHPCINWMHVGYCHSILKVHTQTQNLIPSQYYRQFTHAQPKQLGAILMWQVTPKCGAKLGAVPPVLASEDWCTPNHRAWCHPFMASVTAVHPRFTPRVPRLPGRLGSSYKVPHPNKSLAWLILHVCILMGPYYCSHLDTALSGVFLFWHDCTQIQSFVSSIIILHTQTQNLVVPYAISLIFIACSWSLTAHK